MFLRDDHLFVCDVNRVVVFNLARPEAEPQVVRLPEGELFVNDLVADGNVLYASVTNTGRIFRFDISDLDAVGAPRRGSTCRVPTACCSTTEPSTWSPTRPTG